MPANTQRTKARRWAVVGVGVLVVAMIALAAVWEWTPLHEVAQPRVIARWLRSVADSAWMPPLVAVVYVVASLLMFPNTVLCLAVIMALGPLVGTAYAFGGSLAAALAGYVIGRRGGARVEKLRFKGFDRACAELRRGGFMQVLVLRLLPIAPFTATNILSGVAHVRLLPYVTATLVGIAPYIVTFALFGHQARRLLTDPTPFDVGVTVAIAAVATLALWRARTLAAAHSQ
jgi:phospholipase D1/2